MSPLLMAHPTFSQPREIADHFRAMADLPQEQLRVVLLDRRNRLIDAPLVYQGSQTELTVHLGDCFRDAVRLGAAAIVLLHNHPSGCPVASVEDVRVTRAAGHAGLLLGIPVIDHVILATDGFSSLRAAGLYAPPGIDSDAGPRAVSAPAPESTGRRPQPPLAA